MRLFVSVCLCVPEYVNGFCVCLYVIIFCFVYLCFGVWCALKYVWVFVCLCL